MTCPLTNQPCDHVKNNCVLEVIKNTGTWETQVCNHCFILGQKAVPIIDIDDADEVKTIDDLLAIIKPPKKCKTCGMTAKNFDETKKLGCADCYTTFHGELQDLIANAQAGNTHHCGKIPKSQRTNVLMRELEEAVKAEDYEKAHKIKAEVQKNQSPG